MNPEVDEYIANAQKWQLEMEALRMIVLDCGLNEVVKWGVPVYTIDNKNIVGINGFKEYCALAFFKGVLLQDANGILSQPGTVQAGRYIPFTTVRKILEMEPILKAYIYEAVEVEKGGIKVVKKETSDFAIPDEFQHKLDDMPALKAAFEALTPGRQRAYIFHFSQPKLAKTREARIEKCIPQILRGKGLNDE